MQPAHHDFISKESFPLGKYFAILAKLYLGVICKKLEHLPVERHFYLLLLLDESERDLTQNCLAETLFTDKASMVRVIDYLDEKGMVSRVVNPADRRQHLIRLTPKGKAVVGDIRKAIVELNNTALSHIGEEDIDAFKKSMKQIFNNLKSLPAEQLSLNIKKHKAE